MDNDRMVAKRTCRDCGSTHEYIPTGRTRGLKNPSILHIDETGRAWQGFVCARCHYDHIMQREREKGRKPWDSDHPTETIKKGVEGEKLVERAMLSQGKKVRRVGGRNNPDILWDIGLPSPVSLEVKVVSTKVGSGLYVSAVCKNRSADDYVVLADLRTNALRYFSMEEHLSLCGKSGKRCVTNLFLPEV